MRLLLDSKRTSEISEASPTKANFFQRGCLQIGCVQRGFDYSREYKYV
jgi:hypothetical protein